MVTTAGAEAARNFGLEDEPLHAERYARAAEFLDVSFKLWDSWEDDVRVGDKQSGDNDKIHPVRRRGRYFSMQGALNAPRSPQGYPLIEDLIVYEHGQRRLARREKLTVRQLIGRLGGGRGHRTFTGTPEQVADAIGDWVRQAAADGLNIMPPVLPSGLELFADHVVPILRRRGLFRHEYQGATLRQHYGLDRPANQYVSDTAQPAFAGARA